MIVLLIAASLTSQSVAPPASVGRPARCDIVPSLCLGGTRAPTLPLIGAAVPADDAKMSAYRFDARPCRIVGAQCMKRANRQLFRLGEPITQTLLRSFGLD
ncbi:hypothetical protein [Sphingobium bisphenolivorans]|uniref:hypothetical protein n=1 Tax=Sphingobium bisphenolivorans TaxID=1335760 RepID=UPI0003A53D1D|nr:hypothetical protein [Sphingobium bisphenolivorans]